jgi:hypothetical protein
MSENTVTFNPGGESRPKQRGLSQKRVVAFNCNWNCEKSGGSRTTGASEQVTGVSFYFFISEVDSLPRLPK